MAQSEASVRVIVCLLTCLHLGCSSTIELATPTDANRKIGDGAATVYLKSGREYEARRVNVTMDSTKFVDGDTEGILRFPTHDIRSIQTTHHGGGAVEGLLFGGLGGSAFGLALGLGMGASGEEGMSKGGLFLTGLAVGTVGGLIFGAIKGHDYTFVFPDDSAAVEDRTSREK